MRRWNSPACSESDAIIIDSNITAPHDPLPACRSYVALMLEAHESFATGHLLAEPFPGNRTNPIGEVGRVKSRIRSGLSSLRRQLAEVT